MSHLIGIVERLWRESESQAIHASGVLSYDAAKEQHLNGATIAVGVDLKIGRWELTSLSDYARGESRPDLLGTLAALGNDEIVCIITQAELFGITLVDRPAFLDTRIEVSDVGQDWEGPVAFVDTLTNDNRVIAHGAIEWPRLPIPLYDARGER